MEILRNHKIVTTLSAARSAIVFRIKEEERGEFGAKLFLIEKVFLAVQMLNLLELRFWINVVSSHTYGTHILDQVFPISKNPDAFNSTEFVIDVSDNPVQVLGWKDVETLTEQGVEEGLNRRWIEDGFEDRARERGIDLEWHFYPEPREDTKPIDLGPNLIP